MSALPLGVHTCSLFPGCHKEERRGTPSGLPGTVCTFGEGHPFPGAGVVTMVWLWGCEETGRFEIELWSPSLSEAPIMCFLPHGRKT